MQTSSLGLTSFIIAVGLTACTPGVTVSGGDTVNQSAPDSPKSAPDAIVPPGTNDSQACSNVEWHVVGIYDPWNDATKTLGEAKVHVDRPGPIGLFLTTYTATNWTITTGPNTQIVSIIVSGYDAQTVNAPPGAPVTTMSYEQNGDFIGCGYEYPDTDPNSGCETPQLLNNIEQYVGQSVASFHGCYAASDFVINADLSSSSNCATNMGYKHSNMIADSCTPKPPKPPHPNPSDPGDVPHGCDGQSGVGEYRGYFCEPSLYTDAGPFIVTQEIACQDALENCELNSSLNPDLSIQCTWNGELIYRNEVQAGACNP